MSSLKGNKSISANMKPLSHQQKVNLNLEKTIRKELNVPDGAEHIVILSMDAHMDWDWVLNFQNLALDGNDAWNQKSANWIIDTAFQYMQGNGIPAPVSGSSAWSNTYYYSICEMGFLRAAVETNPDIIKNFKTNIGDKLRIVGGGITSPDNLLPHGELFIRNYLLGKVWMNTNLGLPMRQAYIPDDFGHYSQLPIVLDAMGFEGVSFARCPGSKWQYGSTYTCNHPKIGDQCSVYKTLMEDGNADFHWEAKDGSKVIAHWMQDHYSQGNTITDNASIKSCIDFNKKSSPTPYIYVPCGNDFASPIANLVKYANDWNLTQKFGTAAKPAGTYVVAATLDHYIQLIKGYAQNQPSPSPLKTRPLMPTPYWTGFYASRPELKTLSNAATRSLMGAETFAMLADYLQTASPLTWWPASDARLSSILNGWEMAVPSTHHDFITGTAEDGVYRGEQIPMLHNALALGEGAQQSAMLEISNLVLGSPTQGETPITVFNQVGVAHSGLVALPPRPGVQPKSVRMENGNKQPVQIAENGDYLFLGDAPSMGYQTAYLSDQVVTSPNNLTASANSGNTEFILENSYLKATISQSDNWNISSLIDKKTGKEMIAKGGSGNELEFYIDEGGIYCFGNSTSGHTTFKVDTSGTLTPGTAILVEEGDVRLKLRTVVNFSSGSSGTQQTASYTREYILIADEPMLRMSVTGHVPLTAKGGPNLVGDYAGNPYSVMTKFSFADPTSAKSPQVAIDGMPYGTPIHYEDELSKAYWAPPIFQATHNYLTPQHGGKTLAAIYHGSLPAWAIDGNGDLIGCILRNTPANAWGAAGSDTGTHTHDYAIRIPSGIPTLNDINLLSEAICSHTPLKGVYANIPGGPMGDGKDGTIMGMPATFSLANVSGNAMILAAKAGTLNPDGLVLRVYQPGNTSLNTMLTVQPNPVSSSAYKKLVQVTALENEVTGSKAQSLDGSGNAKVSLEKALSTFLITK